MTDDELAVARAIAAMLPGVAALGGWPHVNWLLVHGLVEGAAEARGVPLPEERKDAVQEEALRLAVPHVVELREGQWRDEFPAFVTTNVHGICTTHAVPWTDEELEADPLVTTFRVCFSDQADAAACRLRFG